MRSSRFYGGLALVGVAVAMFLSYSNLTSTAIAFGVIGLALIAVSRQAGHRK